MAKIGKPKVRGPRKPVKSGDIITIKTLIKHPMESGLRKDKEGNPIPAHFIDKLVATFGGKEIISGDWSGAISKNPYFAFELKATATGDVEVTWSDNQGGSWSAKATVTVA